MERQRENFIEINEVFAILIQIFIKFRLKTENKCIYQNNLMEVAIARKFCLQENGWEQHILRI